MPEISFPYGKGLVTYDIPARRFKGELVSQMHRYCASATQEALVENALAHPVGSPPLSVLARGKKNIVLIASDHTRPVPSRIIVPRMLAEIRRGSPEAEITILIATGCHRDTTVEELEAKFGPEIIRREKIILHDCDSPDMVNLGKLPSGGDLIINRIAVEAELLIAEGFIEPHFFAGFSGGRKSVLPGVASRKTVVYNHNAEFIAHPAARTGVLVGNPIHADMIYAARQARLAFICNVVINSRKEIIYAAAGDCDLAHRDGAEFLSGKCGGKAVSAVFLQNPAETIRRLGVMLCQGPKTALNREEPHALMGKLPGRQRRRLPLLLSRKKIDGFRPRLPASCGSPSSYRQISARRIAFSCAVFSCGA